jgi:predicted amidohydrolase YtcJ
VVGSNAEIAALRRISTEVIDAGGTTVVPGRTGTAVPHKR